MATTLVLICAASTRSSRIGGFPAPDEPLDEPGRHAGQAVLAPRFHANIAISPMRAARESAEAMGLEGRVEPALADIGYGRWAGRTFEDVHDRDAEAFSAWMADPTSACPEGEAMVEVGERVGAWLGALATPTCAITHPTVIRAALAHSLDMPLRSTLAIDIAPLSRTTLSYNRRWRLQSIVPHDVKEH